MSGKGDKRRKGSDDVAYAKGWDRIFKKPNKKEVSKENEKKAK